MLRAVPCRRLATFIPATLADELLFDGQASAGSLRKMLVSRLGEDIFNKAHARLRHVVEEEDDDALVADIQLILGAGASPSHVSHAPQRASLFASLLAALGVSSSS